jgi:uncharacterized membrane protein HdeD (DUF308 family)
MSPWSYFPATAADARVRGVHRPVEKSHAVGSRLTQLIGRGFVAVVFGLGCFGLTTVSLFLPRITTGVLDLVFGSYALVDGVMALAFGGWAAARGQVWPAVILRGIVGLVAGLFSLHAPLTTPQVSAHVIGGWALLTGLLDLATGIALGPRDRLVALGWIGAISIAFGILLLAAPEMWILLLLVAVGFHSVLGGTLLLACFLRRADF